MFAATQQIASVAGLKATKVQVRVSFFRFLFVIRSDPIARARARETSSS